MFKKLLLVSSLIGLTNCGPQERESTLDTFNSRPTNFEQTIALVKLKEPALLATAEIEEGKTFIAPESEDAIEAEQQAFLTEVMTWADGIKVLQKFKYVVNAVAILAPASLEEKFRGHSRVATIEGNAVFTKPDDEGETSPETIPNLETVNSAAFIGALEVQSKLKVKEGETEVPVNGAGIHVGVIDSGIDYTHAMFGGVGTAEAYAKDDHNVVEEGSFPTAKVVGGIDLVGTDYNAAAPIFEFRIPKPDQDPIDEGGHGTHVAGTIAGIGNHTQTYNGVAPEAKLHAIKVFGKNGSTSMSVIIAGLEYAADPNSDGDVSDRLDVVNLSLGSPYGAPLLLYGEAIRNLSRGGTAVVASAGNSGHLPYIVGSPGSTNEAISVAASVDNMEHNYKFSAIELKLGEGVEPQFTELFEATFTKPVSEFESLIGEFVAIGTAHEELSEEQQAAVRGKIALIDRGIVAFYDKVKRAKDAGAIGVVIANNKEGEPFRMGGNGDPIDIPAVMIDLATGNQIKEAMKSGPVTVNFKTAERIEKPWLIDTLTSFSSRGPRSFDSVLKPEVAAPGQSIISAKMGAGTEGVPMSGTSMAAPHTAGAVALLRQYRKDLTPSQIKAALMASAKNMKVKEDVYDIAMQGAGRIDVFQAAQVQVLAWPPAVSLGEHRIQTRKTVRISFELENLAQQPATYTLVPSVDPGLAFELPKTVTLEPGAKKSVVGKVTIFADRSDAFRTELDGRILVKQNDTVVAQLPVLAVLRKTSNINVDEVAIQAGSKFESANALGTVTLTNQGLANGRALLFNLIGTDDRRHPSNGIPFRDGACDLEAVGYRLFKDKVGEEMQPWIEFAFKTYQPLTTWDFCEANIQIDKDGDGVADLELSGLPEEGTFQSYLYDAAKLRAHREEYISAYPDMDRPNFDNARVALGSGNGFPSSTVATVAIPLTDLGAEEFRTLHVKMGLLADAEVPLGDDFFAKHATEWETISLNASQAAYAELPSVLTLAPGETKSVDIVSGAGLGSLLALFPDNWATASVTEADRQSAIPAVTFQ